jgi:hypothetical protein
MSKTIYGFKKGDNITRIEPAKQCGTTIFGTPGCRDRSYIGDRLIFVGIANGCVYLKRTDIVEQKIFGSRLIDLELDIFSEGWDYYIDPNKLLEDLDESIIMSKEQILDQISKAIVDENYELAAKLKKQLKKK